MRSSFISIIFCLALQLSSIAQEWYAGMWEYRYMPGTTQPDSGWNTLDYIDTTWAKGEKAIGYGFNTAEKQIDSIIIQPTTSLYLRIPFKVHNIPSIKLLSLMVDFNDGFVAYLNGIEVVRVNMGKKNTTTHYLQTADRTHIPYEARDFCSPNFSYFIDSTTIASLLIDSMNVLAIEVHNDSVNGSNLHFNGYLVDQSDPMYHVYNWESRGVKQVELDSTHLPVVIITTGDTAFEQCKTRYPASMKIIHHPGTLNSPKDTDLHFSGKISIKTRGESTGSWPKKCYDLETQDALGNNLDTSLLGLPSENDWILFGPFADRSQLRNSIMYDLSRRMGHWAPRTVFCELIINDEFDGLYLFMESVKRDKNRVKIAKLEPADTSALDLSGGYIFKYDKGSAAIQITYPESEDITPAQSAYIVNHFKKFQYATGDSILLHPTKGYKNYIGVNSYIDFTLLNELCKNPDAYLYSTYMHKEKDNDGGKIKFGPLWDYDLAFGNAKWQNGDRTYGWQYNESQNTRLLHKRIFKDTAMVHQFQNTWWELRKTIFHKDSLFNRIDSMIAAVQPAIARNYEVWPLDNRYMDVWGNNSLSFSNSYANEIPKLKRWIGDRIDWMDANMSKIYFYYNYANAIAETQSIMQAIDVNPNPFTDYLQVSYSLKQEGVIQVTLYDLYGSIQYNSSKQLSEHGQYSETISLPHLAKGFYMISILANGQVVYNQKLIKTE